jgi:hypothetical protein
MHFARYETPMSAGFRKYALLYRKAATMQSRDSAPTRPDRPPIGNSPLQIRSRRDLLRQAFISPWPAAHSSRHRRAAHHDSGGICANEPR